MLNPRLKRILNFLRCPQCGGELKETPKSVACSSCDVSYKVESGKIFFTQAPARSDPLDQVKGTYKKVLGRNYHRIGINILAPTFPFNFSKKIKQIVNPVNHFVVDIGSGNNRIDPDIINVDIFDYENVDIITDLKSLPFKDKVIDMFCSRSVLEHVDNFDRCISEIDRCTKVEGYSAHLIPFMYPFHASPYDFRRFTHEGQKKIFTNWTLIDQWNPTGPATLFVVSLAEFLSILFAGAFPKLRRYIYLLLCVCLFPIKYIDVFFVWNTSFITMAPTIFFIVKKDRVGN